MRNGAFVNAPDLRYTALARYTRPLAAASQLHAQVNYRWQDDVQFAYDQDPRFLQRAYGIADFKVGASFADGRYEASGFVRNAFDKQYVANVIAQGAAGGGAIANAIPRDFHRYFGGELSVKF